MGRRSALLRVIVFGLVSGLLTCSCSRETAAGGEGGAIDGTDGGEAGTSGDDAGPPLPASPDLQSRIADAIRSVRADTCFAQDDPSSCAWADYEVGPAHFDMAQSTGEAILVIDEFVPGFFPELVRYRNRIEGFYRVQGDQVEPQVLSVRLPERLGDVLVSFAGPEFIPASALAPVAEAVSSVYSKLNLIYYAHGGVIFAHLSELVPEQPLVLLDLAGLLDVPLVVCTGINESTLAAAKLHVTALAASLAQVISEHHVRFINASFGSSTSTLAADWPNRCGGAVPSAAELQRLLPVYAPIYELLFHSEGVVAAQAATALGAAIDYPFDQVSAQYGNRVRVGFISSLASGLDAAGRGVLSAAQQFPATGDADIFLNWGCESAEVCAEPHYRFAGPFGLGTGTLPIMSTSYVTPLALARIINLRYANHADEPLSNPLVQALRQELTPALCEPGAATPCVFQDPLVHRQLEPYRLHYE